MLAQMRALRARVWTAPATRAQGVGWLAGMVRLEQMHCCSEMTDRLNDETGILYIPKFREYGIRVLDGGSSFVLLRFCPWCGVEIPTSLRDEWFQTVEKLGLEPASDDLPREFLGDGWWTRGAGNRD